MPMRTMLKRWSEHVELAQQDADLADDFARRQVADDAHAPGEAEGALHRAADLRRDAEGLRRRVGDEDRLDQVAVGELEEELRRCRPSTVPASRPPACRPTGGSAEPVAELAAEVGHGAEVGHAAAIDPLEDLPPVEARDSRWPRDAVRSRRARARPRRCERRWSWGGPALRWDPSLYYADFGSVLARFCLELHGSRVVLFLFGSSPVSPSTSSTCAVPTEST